MNKWKRYITLLLVLVVCVSVTSPIEVLANSKASDAVSDIMNNSRFTGAIETISWLTGLVDYWFTMIITATAFFIISSAMLKNVCAGAYLSNHKFWDKVAEAHEKTEALNIAGMVDYFKGKRFMETSAGGVRDFLLGLVPNIRAWTDFDDADIEPRKYWTKAIPQMFGCIIIGVFIYNGFYRDAAGIVGNFGSEICNRVFCSIDPASFLDKVTQTTSTPDNIYSSDQTIQGQHCYTLSMELYKTYLSASKELHSTEAKTSLMRDCENIAYNLTKDSTWLQSNCYGETRKYDFNLTNLNITACPASGKELGKLHLEAVDKDTKSKFTAVGYVDAPTTAKNYVKNDAKACYVTFVMSGEERKTSSVGLTNIQSAAGSWGNYSGDPVTLTVSRAMGKSTYKTTTDQGGGKQITARVYLNDYASSLNSSLEQSAKDFCSDNGLNYVGSMKIVAYNTWDAGTAQNPIVVFNKVQSGASRNCSVRVTFTCKPKDADSSAKASTEQLSIPITVVVN